jgi:glutaredoxin 3
MSIIVYSTPTCTYCKKLKDFIKSHGKKLTEINVSADPEARAHMVEISGGLSIPVLDVDGNILVGFDESQRNLVVELINKSK